VSVQTGTVVGDYEVLARLGTGGAARVYRVRHKITGRIEAMKVLLPDHAEDDEQAQRFLREVRVQAELSHPNIASVLNAFWVDRTLVLVMEYVGGQSLDKVLETGRLPLTQALDYASQTLSALTYAHSRGVVHRDIKPANLLLTPSGVLKVSDFGLAKISEGTSLTDSGVPMGSFYYASPEQIRGLPTIDERADIYSMGAVVYELATGRKPFLASQPFDLMQAHISLCPEPPSDLDASIPPILSKAIMKALEKEPRDRFASAEEFQAQIEGTLRALGAEVTKPWEKGSRTVRHGLVGWSFAALAHAVSWRVKKADLRTVTLVVSLLMLFPLLALFVGSSLRQEDLERNSPFRGTPVESRDPSPPSPSVLPPSRTTTPEPRETKPTARAATTKRQKVTPKPPTFAPPPTAPGESKETPAEPEPLPLEKPSPLGPPEEGAPDLAAAVTVDRTESSTRPVAMNVPARLRIRMTRAFGSDIPNDLLVAEVVAPATLRGAIVSGQVIDSKSRGQSSGESNLKLQFDSFRRDGRAAPIECRIAGFRNSNGEGGVDEEGHKLKRKKGVIERGTDVARRIRSVVGGVFGAGKGESQARNGNVTTLTAKAPRITFGIGSEFDLRDVSSRDP